MGPVSLRLATGEAVLGSVIVPVALVGERGALRVGGAAGAVVRPLRFGERWHAVRHALTAPDPLFQLAGAVGALASAQGVAADEVPEVDDGGGAVDMVVVVEVLALHLAGAGSGGPGFATVTAVLTRTLGWGPQALAASDASDADHLARLVTDAAATDDEWQRVVFDAAGAEDLSGSLAALRDELAADLLRRGQEPPDLSLVDLGRPDSQAPAHSHRPPTEGDLERSGDHELLGRDGQAGPAHVAAAGPRPVPVPRSGTTPAPVGSAYPDALAGTDYAAGTGRGVEGLHGGADRPAGGAGDGAGPGPAHGPDGAADDDRAPHAGGSGAWGEAVLAAWAPPRPSPWPPAGGARSPRLAPAAAGTAWAGALAASAGGAVAPLADVPVDPGPAPLTLANGDRTPLRMSSDGLAGGSPGGWISPEQLADAVASELHHTADLRGIDG